MLFATWNHTGIQYISTNTLYTIHFCRIRFCLFYQRFVYKYTIPFYYARRELFAFQILVEDCWTTKNQFKPFIKILLQEIIKALPKGLKIVDLSAVSTGCIFFRCPVCNLMSYSFQSYLIMQDFRLQDIDDYEKWYGQPHRAPELQVGLYMFNKNIWCIDFNEFTPLDVHFYIME